LVIPQVVICNETIIKNLAFQGRDAQRFTLKFLNQNKNNSIKNVAEKKIENNFSTLTQDVPETRSLHRCDAALHGIVTFIIVNSG
jgi:CHAD domain-containing protein